MPEIVIKQADKDFLTVLFAEHADSVAQLPDLLRRFHPRSTHHPNTLFANFDEAELELRINALGDAFISSGMKEDNEPNALGLRIEGYIDMFNEPNLN